MTRNRRNPLGVFLHEVTAAGDEFAALCTRLAGQDAPAATFPINVWQDENAVFVEGDLPGVDRATLDVTVTGGDTLTIRAERPAATIAEGTAWLRRERAIGKFSRVLNLSTLVDAEKVEASYVNGVLKVTLPKVAAVKPRTVPIKAE
ncbi:Heat shock protein, HSP20 OS=Rhodopirellula maiorica SM1 GN=RMSM_05792 PE=3 SV=1: HSP20 [Gemmata massiliana]|uniref:SHSP domain-containing protein n=1 Tax=Gemmata massiliana TaxID=1210884 RepID=A0A6P2D6K6_9BACT|nr:Hsp20/alpha crystallin family protein [Gemmata massiliana]VTR96779.1 Heat shock protein, HSP20 OS=Rhodopirellula maiorica SM1 GN=RMSM_05792 PE=3 SV=1: HSP20 [Gemmata massiliana]